jgi:hypothetical protein
VDHARLEKPVENEVARGLVGAAEQLADPSESIAMRLLA